MDAMDWLLVTRFNYKNSQVYFFQFFSSQNNLFARILAWHIIFERCKALKKDLNAELMPVAWHPNRWWAWCVSDDEKKEIDPMFIEEL